MCDAVFYLSNGSPARIYFSNPKAVLPVRNKRLGTQVLVPWGRRQSQPGELPLGGSITHQSICKGKWDRFFPKSVLVPACSFGLRDFEGNVRWYDLIPGQWLHATYLKSDTASGVYLLTIDPELPDLPHPIWPKIVSVP